MIAQARRAARGRPWVVCADFDDTISAGDTISDLATLACMARRASLAVWTTLTQQYMDEYGLVMAGIPRTLSPPRPYDPVSLQHFLANFAAVDKASIDRVVASSVLAGLSRPAIVAGAKARVTLQPGAAAVLSASAHPLVIVSSNWSVDWLTSAMDTIPFDGIVTNDLAFGPGGISTGHLVLRMQSPNDKAACVARLQREREAAAIFIGDGVNDLLALLQADVGFLLGGPATSAARVATHFGIRIETLKYNEATLESLSATAKAAKATGSPLLFRAPHWNALQFLSSKASVGNSPT
ncbi:hypothetical protein ACHHYP_04328 [Achlya hypogyna]|uniref:Uncharacterized protein n=1 Tax=Achlya hypogyna TaxID=1202772 RepID=A0A1V9ZP94_ACHHY|nr:hypothetical protein ACHHYP_04328 [Achlya hypogyna]